MEPAADLVLELEFVFLSRQPQQAEQIAACRPLGVIERTATNVVDDALTTARTAPDSAGQLRVLAGNLPIYLCWLRDDGARFQMRADLAEVAARLSGPGRLSPMARASALIQHLMEGQLTHVL